MAIILKQRLPLDSARIDGAVVDAAARARAIVEAAQDEASEIRKGIAVERERARAAGETEGYETGRGRAAALLAAAAAERDRLLGTLARDVASLALDVARRILGRELATAPGAVVDVAARTLEGARERAVVTLRASPADVPRLREAEPRLSALLARAPGVALREDPSLAPGDVVVETEAGRLDGRVAAQLAALERALAEVGS
ncbi:FliH/SctL family protein [Anaeromyxobacter oryzae]|uniref:Flagellar assembly protein FliH n=1 Tax=Anaeromyxobacter oryzae TaxID=2918170 RepID=A0ABN6MZR5_9BACT|nr:FliH/SctL family protein [Anaeromyxobacter oryzae]BDG06447.1 hypothetical protein AMOR_54430 [Anaeromyxobacter oryzae]